MDKSYLSTWWVDPNSQVQRFLIVLTIACCFSGNHAVLVYFVVRGQSGLAPARVAIVYSGRVVGMPGKEVRVQRPAEAAASDHVRLTVLPSVIDVVVGVVHIDLDSASRRWTQRWERNFVTFLVTHDSAHDMSFRHEINLFWRFLQGQN